MRSLACPYQLRTREIRLCDVFGVSCSFKIAGSGKFLGALAGFNEAIG